MFACVPSEPARSNACLSNATSSCQIVPELLSSFSADQNLRQSRTSKHVGRMKRDSSHIHQRNESCNNESDPSHNSDCPPYANAHPRVQLIPQTLSYQCDPCFSSKQCVCTQHIQKCTKQNQFAHEGSTEHV